MIKRTIAYYRVSTKNQSKEQTIKTQQFKVKKFAKENGYQIIKEYSDNGLSGSLKNRPGLKKMLDEISKYDIKYILIYKLDRLARDVHIQEGLVREFNKREIKLVSTEEPDLAGNDPFRKAFRQMLGIFSEFEKSMITLRLESGRERKAQEGGWHGGRIYGYTSKKGKLIINPEEAKVIKLIHILRKKKLSYRDIAETLNDKKIESARSKSIWRPSTVRRMYKNKIYKNGSLNYKGQIIKDTKIPPILKS